jgi:Uma2 family endonuclease
MVIAKPELISEEKYREIALGDPKWELHHGRLREKPGMSMDHGGSMVALVEQLLFQLDRTVYTLRFNHARLRVSADTYYIPDVVVIPVEIERALRKHTRTLDAYSEPLPLVVEIWSPSTGDDDIRAKIPVYQERGDEEIWFIHPEQRTLTAWRKQSDGDYERSTYRGGIVYPQSLPGVAIDLEALFPG